MVNGRDKLNHIHQRFKELLIEQTARELAELDQQHEERLREIDRRTRLRYLLLAIVTALMMLALVGRVAWRIWS